MALSWWDIPGPSRFVRRVENDLRDRVNVLAALPAGLGREWFDFFRRRWADDQERMDVLRVSTDVPSPLDQLCGAFTTHPLGTMTIGALAQEANVQRLALNHLAPRPRGRIQANLFFRDPARAHYSGDIYVGTDGMQIVIPVP